MQGRAGRGCRRAAQCDDAKSRELFRVVEDYAERVAAAGAHAADAVA